LSPNRKTAGKMNGKSYTGVIYAVTIPLFVVSLMAISDAAKEDGRKAGENMSTRPVYISDALKNRIWSAQQWGALGFNTSVVSPHGGKPLKLLIGKKEYAKGLGSHANGEIRVDLAGEYETFEAEVGVLPEVKGKGSVIFKVLVDGRERFNSGVMRGGQPAKKVKVDVRGAAELALVGADAGDGIAYDVANWAEARLTPTSSALAKIVLPAANDIAPAAQVLTLDPKCKDGSLQQPKGVSGGGWVLPLQADGSACLVLLWDDLRSLYRITIEFPEDAKPPAAGSVKLQAKAWSGWDDVRARCYTIRNTMTWLIDTPLLNEYGTRQIRWVFRKSKQPVKIKSVHAYDRSREPKTVELLIQAASPASGAVPIEMLNGSFVKAGAGSLTRRLSWNTARPLKVKINYLSRPVPPNLRAAICFRIPGDGFAVAINDVLANKCVYVPRAGVFVKDAAASVSLKQHLAAVKAGKRIVQRVKEMPDQTFAQAMARTHNPLQDWCPTMLSLACDNRKLVVNERDGVMELVCEADINKNWHAYPNAVRLKIAVKLGTDRQKREYSRRLEKDCWPIPVATTKMGAIVYRQRTCVAPVDDKSPAGMPDFMRRRALGVAEFTIENIGKSTAEVSATFSFTAAPGKTARLKAVKDGAVITTAGDVTAYVKAVATAGLVLKVAKGTLAVSGKLAGGESARFYMYLPLWKVPAGDYATLAGGEKAFERAVAYWRTLTAPAMQVDIPDKLLGNIIRASQIHCMLAAHNEQDGKLIAAWIASDRYGALDSESQAVIRGMDMMGQSDFARRSLNYWLSKYNKQGFFLNYSIAGVGENLWTMAEHYDRTGDRAWLKKAAPKIIRACKWIMSERRKTMTGKISGRKPPEWGLIPPGTTADWQLRAHRFFNDAQFCAGLAQAARVLAEINHPQALAIAKEAKSYRQDILRAYRWNQSRSPVLPLGDGAWVPHYPSILYCFVPSGDRFPGQDWGRTWCYDTEAGAHHLLATRVLSPLGGDADDMINHMEEVQFMRAGLGDYPAEKVRKDFFSLGGFAKLQPYYCRIAEIYAHRDDVKPFIRAYFNALATLVSREDLSLWEHYANQGAWNKTHETGWFLCQTRIMFVSERGGELWLAPFVTSNWLKDGMTVAVRNAPTRFGKVGYDIKSFAAKGYIEVSVNPPVSPELKRIVLRLRHPAGKKIKSVTVNGKSHSDFDNTGEILRLPPSKKPMTIRVEYKR